jgi:hypothetical protein
MQVSGASCIGRDRRNDVTQPPRSRHGALTAWWTTAAVAALVLVAPGPVEAVELLTEDPVASDPTAPLVAAAAAIAWGLAGWLALTAVVTAVAARSGPTGAVAGAIARRLAPAAVRRAVEVSLGLTVAVGTLGVSTAASADVATPPAASPAPAPPAAAALLDWPTVPATGAPSRASATSSRGPVDPVHPTAAGPSTTTLPAPGPSAGSSAGAVPPRAPFPAQSAGAPAGPAPTPTPPSTSSSPISKSATQRAPASPAPVDPVPPTPGPTRTAPSDPAGPGLVAQGASAAAVAATVSDQLVVVQPGDSLWLLARRDLQAAGAPAAVRDVAAAWPRWWAANREVIGDDPDLLRPGARLTAPPPA